MTTDTMTKFQNALTAVGINDYQLSTDLGTHYYNNEKAIILVDNTTESVLNLRSKDKIGSPAYEGPICIYETDFADIHEARLGCNAEEAKKFVEAYGLSLTSDQFKILLDIESNNTNINSPRNYQKFHFLTEEEIAALSAEEKVKYESDLAKWNESHGDLKKGDSVTVKI